MLESKREFVRQNPAQPQRIVRLIEQIGICYLQNRNKESPTVRGIVF